MKRQCRRHTKDCPSSYESSVVYEESDKGVKKPIIAKELMPEVKGVLVVAEGASDATVKENLVNSVKVCLIFPFIRYRLWKGENKFIKCSLL